MKCGDTLISFFVDEVTKSHFRFEANSLFELLDDEAYDFFTVVKDGTMKSSVVVFFFQ